MATASAQHNLPRIRFSLRAVLFVVLVVNVALAGITQAGEWGGMFAFMTMLFVYVVCTERRIWIGFRVMMISASAVLVVASLEFDQGHLMWVVTGVWSFAFLVWFVVRRSMPTIGDLAKLGLVIAVIVGSIIAFPHAAYLFTRTRGYAQGVAAVRQAIDDGRVQLFAREVEPMISFCLTSIHGPPASYLKHAEMTGYYNGVFDELPPSAGDKRIAQSVLESQGAYFGAYYEKLEEWPAAVPQHFPTRYVKCFGGRFELENFDLQYLQLFDNIDIVDLTDESRITDESIRFLKHLSTVAVLKLRGTKVTNEGIRELQRALPNCHIIK